LDKIYT
jgi:hypothetical protein